MEFGVRSCYDESKRCGEAVIFSYNERHGTRHGLVRIFNTYGPRMNPDDGRVVINFLVQGMNGQALTVHGDCKQTRSFCYVSDLIEGIFMYAERDLNRPVNIGNPTEFTILELVDVIRKILSDKKLDVSFKPMPLDDPKRRRPDIRVAQDLMKPWALKVPLEQGLRHMIEWLKTK